VYFFSLDAASRLAVRAARLTFGLPYHHADMSLSREGDVVAYSSARRQLSAAALTLRIRPGSPLGPLREGTIDHFLLERYLLFVSRRGRIQSTQVHHVPYPAYAATVLDVEDGLVAAAGLPPVAGPPTGSGRSLARCAAAIPPRSPSGCAWPAECPRQPHKPAPPASTSESDSRSGRTATRCRTRPRSR
jgi:hypothetical protein